jgi:hypothetical protein
VCAWPTRAQKRQRYRRVTVHLKRLHPERLEMTLEFWDAPRQTEPIVLGRTDTRGAQRAITTAYREEGYLAMGRWQRETPEFPFDEHWRRSFQFPEPSIKEMIATMEALIRVAGVEAV